MPSDTYAVFGDVWLPRGGVGGWGAPFCVWIACSFQAFAQKTEHHPCAPFSGTALSLRPWGLGPEAQLFSLKRWDRQMLLLDTYPSGPGRDFLARLCSRSFRNQEGMVPAPPPDPPASSWGMRPAHTRKALLHFVQESWASEHSVPLRLKDTPGTLLSRTPN